MDLRKNDLSFWKEHLSNWKTSDISQAAYCRKHGLSIKTFGRWKNKLSSTKSSFVEVVPSKVNFKRMSFDVSIDSSGKVILSFSIPDVF